MVKLTRTGKCAGCGLTFKCTFHKEKPFNCSFTDISLQYCRCPTCIMANIKVGENTVTNSLLKCFGIKKGSTSYNLLKILVGGRGDVDP
jgi:hypothetical protein